MSTRSGVGATLSELLAKRERAFDERFQRAFGAFAPGTPNGVLRLHPTDLGLSITDIES